MRRLFLFVVLLTTPALAAIHYVNNSGTPACSDSGTGTQAAPWCTFSYGVAHILGGDTLNVMTGTYTGDFTITGPSGTAGAHTIIQAGPGQTPVINGPGYNSGRMKISHGCSYIDFIGFTITNHNQGLYLDDDAGTSTACTNLLIDHITVYLTGQEGIAVRAGTTGSAPRNFVISNSIIHDTGQLAPNQNGEGIYLGNSSGTDTTNGVTLLNNTIYNTSAECIELKGDSHDNIVDGNDLSNCITSNSTFGNTGGAIEIDEPRNSVTDPHQIIRNNVIHDMPNAGGITKRGIRAGTGATIYNNVLYNIGNTYSCILSNSPNYPRLVYYNTVDCTTGNAVVNSGGTNLDNRDNIGPTGTANLAISSAYFTNYAGHDYHLVAASAPTTAGVNLTATVPNDITGTSRSSAPTSIGAYLAVAAPVACTSAAINAAITSAPTGGTVTVNAGSCTWSSAVNISKAVKVVGATTCTGAGTTLACTDNTIITCSATPCLSITGTVGAIVDFSGFSLTTSGSAQVEVGKISISGDAVGAAFRLHHSHITASDCTSYMNTDEAYGLIDHVLFDIAGTCKMAVFGHWSDAGFSSWNASQAWGNSQALYIEDSRWNANNLVDGDIDGYAGGRLVVRHSYLVFTGASNGDSIGFHGLDSGGYRSFMTFESYNNTYTNNGSSQLQAGHLRGGTALFHDNTFNGSGVWNGVNIQILRNLGQSYSWTPCNGTSLKATPVGGPPSSSWGASAGGTYKFCAVNRDVYCTADATCSAITGGDTCSTFLDGSGTNGYACRDQGGRTHNQVLSPVYAWNNGSDATCATGGSCTNGVQSVGGDDGGGGQLVANRDFINGSAAPGYSPYTYPHPLQSAAPGNFSISGSLGANAANATVTWPESGGGTVSADGSGNYTIPNLANGTYTVTPQKTGFTFTPTNRSVTVSGANVTGINFTAALAAIYSISGQVTFNAGSTDPDPVTISLTGTSTGSTTTDGSGNYTLSGLTNGTYTVTPSKATYTFAPTNIAGIVILGANQTGKNFVATGTAAAVLTPTTWDFGSQGIGIPSAGKVIQLSNTGTGQLTSIVVSDSGTNAGNFSETTSPTPNCGGTLNAGANCDITVIFTPSALGVRNANLSVTDNLGTQTAALTGQGYQAPVPSCTPMGGTYKTARLVNCTNAVPVATMCWKIGSPPVTNGGGSCTVGSGTFLYAAGGILMTDNGPLYVTGTQAGNIDNTVGYAFTVSPSWTSGWVMQRNETGITHMGTGGGVVIFSAYTGAAIVQPPATPDVGNLIKNNAIVTDASYPSGTQARIGRCTDQAFTPTLGLGNHSKAAGLGGSADAMQLFNTNSTMLQIEDTGGSNFLTLFNKATMTCGGAITDGPHNITNGGSATNAHNFSSGSFSWTDPNVWYTFGQGPDTTPTQAIKYTFNTSTGDFITGPLIADLQYGLPLNLTAWQQTHAYTAGAYVSYTLSGAEAPDWASGHAYVLGDIIKPLTNNASGCAFKVTTAGTSNSTPPGSWGATCGVLTVSDGATVKWRGIGGPPIFTYQLTSAGGQSGGSTPAFVPGDGHPQLMTTVTDGALTWTNTGPMVLPAWQSFAGISRDSTRLCSAFNSNSYMYNAIPRNGIQGEGIYAACYDATANKYHLLNTATAWMSTSTCSTGVGGGYACSGGTWTLAPDGKLTGWPQAGDCGMRIHNMKGSSKMDYPIVASQAPVATGISPCVTEGGATTTSVVWSPFATFSAANSGKPETQGLNHWAMGATHVLNVGQSIPANGFTTGAYTMYTDLTNPTAQSPITWQPTCAVSWSAGNPLPPCTFAAAYDSHMGWAYNPGDLDTSPICGTMYSLTNLNPIPDAPWQSEEVCVPTSPQWTDTNKPGNAANPWRFTHSFSTGTNQSFSSQFSISQMSQDGKYLAFGSDWMCTLGSTDGTSNSLCGLQWKPSTAYTIGTMLNPYSSNGGSGTDFGVWQVNTNGTSSPSTKPPWVPCPGAGNVNLGTTITDTLATPIPMVFTCLGAGNGRGDVFVVELAP